MIHHLSYYPSGDSINDGISQQNSSVAYSRVDDAVNLIKNIGHESFLAKTDIKNAFRIIPIEPADYDLLGMSWKEEYYYDHCMPMGCSGSCKTFEIFSSSLEWIAKKYLNIPHIIHLLDDFLTAAPSVHQCRINLNAFLSLCDYLGVAIAPEKILGPFRVLSFAIIELDTMHGGYRLPDDELEKCKTLISTFLRRKKVKLRELQSLIGLLNFACSVVVPGCAFLCRLIDLTKGVESAHHFIRFNKSVER